MRRVGARCVYSERPKMALRQIDLKSLGMLTRGSSFRAHSGEPDVMLLPPEWLTYAAFPKAHAGFAGARRPQLPRGRTGTPRVGRRAGRGKIPREYAGAQQTG